MKRFGWRLVLGRIAAAVLVACMAIGLPGSRANADEPVRVAIGDVPGADWLIMLIGLEHAKAAGIDYELLWLNQEDTVNQAVLNGQADLGTGTPYTIIQNIPDQMRFVFQNYKTQFYAVANKSVHPDWASVDGMPITLHAQAGATTVMAILAAEANGIEFSEMIFLPGSEVRGNALLEGTVNLAYIDATNKDRVLSERPGEFHVLPAGDVSASDEAIFARIDWIEANRDKLDTIIEAFLHVNRRVAADPFYALEERARLGLLTDLPPEVDAAVAKYMIEGAADGIFPTDLGGRKAAEQDLLFFSTGGQIEGDPASLKVEDFWFLEPLEAAIARLGSADVSYSAP
jgi:NitT/TauT family transport system substrate-binding protein